MSFFRSLVTLASAVCAIFTAYAFGHGLSNHHSTPFLLAGVAFAATVLLIVLQVKVDRKEAP